MYQRKLTSNDLSGDTHLKDVRHPEGQKSIISDTMVRKRIREQAS
jgi:hypothetical protein